MLENIVSPYSDWSLFILCLAQEVTETTRQRGKGFEFHYSVFENSTARSRTSASGMSCAPPPKKLRWTRNRCNGWLKREHTPPPSSRK